MADGPTLRTDRLLLRRWRETDREPFALLNADADVMRYLPKALDRSQSDALIDCTESEFAELGYGLWAVEVASSARFIGFTGLDLKTFEAPFTPAVEVGWRLRRDAWGRGYATEAATSALDFAFGSLELADVVSMTTVANARSQAVMRRLGMTRDVRDDFAHPALPGGHPLRPHVLYRMTRDDWLSRSDLDAPRLPNGPTG